ncbi:hypothetical protein [Streptomyces sp. NPDC089919]|uniref:hypothetical protein n=1 Tax=Streptomyces sp. NPDC089919 TaxID=3155188 RepID=UPI003440A46C
MDTKNTDAPTAASDEAAEPRTGTDPVVGEKPDEDLLDALDQDADQDALDPDGLADEQPAADGAAAPAPVGAGAGAVAAAGLGLAALSGTWVSRVVAERQTLIGQIKSTDATSTAEKISALYGDAWHQTALVNGAFSLLAVLVALFVLARPAFGAPGRVLPVWIRALAWGAVALGVIGMIIAGLMYGDVLLPLPKAA